MEAGDGTGGWSRRMEPEAGTANDTGAWRNRSTATKGGAAATLWKHRKPGSGCPEVRFEPVVEPELPDADQRLGLAVEITSARHKRTAPLNQRGEIADLRCIVVVVEDLQPLSPEVEQSLGHTFPATEIKPGMPSP